ncbi:acyltransferase [Micromonospora sp. NPDC047812]|uniref:acyltransferase n=1 Tax=Micromonospora sp. NPDC047812 TaxID=3155742 RepID=UPI0034529296
MRVVLMRVDSCRPMPLVYRVARVLDGAWTVGSRIRRAVRGWATAPRFAVRGDRVAFDPDGIYTYETIELGSDVDLGYRPVLIAARSRIRIGNNVMFGPEVTIRGGNHRIDRVGVPMIAVRKQAGDEQHDRGVTIGDDVWVGTRAIILHGVTVGRGAVIGAGAVVTRSVPPYAIVAGNPARVVRLRWPVETIIRHERELYPPGQRLEPGELTALAQFVAPAPRSAPVTNPLTADLQDR